MNGEIRRVKGNMRYRVLTSNEAYYLIDMGNSPWKILFPHFFWIFPNLGYKLDKDSALKLTLENTSQIKTGRYALLGGGLSIPLTTLLAPLVESLDVVSSVLFNSLLAIILVSIMTFLTFIVFKNKKQGLKNTINYTELPKTKIKITRSKFSEIIKFTFVYLTSIAASLIPIIVFIQYSNLFMLFSGLIFLVIFIIISGTILSDGKYKVKME
ncbi:tandem five-transmembrane protein [Terribacillus halophilus]|uniref:Tandem five-transmembrane protein n=1 Tax=Terribacillus halophilus TaxID=361279 RepID=A0A1G6L043_9BACI|nr:DUF443 family protein [Terribacillus halophilus]SDC36438.1 tandem five-transmembrane protein [Terribacillus halophilus]